jgi:hypothetical protein
MRGLGTGGESVGGPDYGVRVAEDALGASTIYDKRSLNYVGLKPTWKGNLCLLFLVAMIVSVSIFLCSSQNDWPSGLRDRGIGHTFLALGQRMWVIRGIKGEKACVDFYLH